MLTIEEVKKLLGNDKIPDKEAGEIRDYCYGLAELALENLKLTRTQNLSDNQPAKVEIRVFTFAVQTIIIKA